MKATVTRIEKNYSDFKIEFNEITITITGRNTALLIAKCLEKGFSQKMIFAVGVYDTKALKNLLNK